MVDIYLALFVFIYSVMLSLIASREYITDFGVRDYLLMLVTAVGYTLAYIIVSIVLGALSALPFLSFLAYSATQIAVAVGILVALWILLGRPATVPVKKVKTVVVGLVLAYIIYDLLLWVISLVVH